jgi:hypothetical protein
MITPRPHHLHRILDLPAIQLPQRQFLDVLIVERLRCARPVFNAMLLRRLLGEALEELAPDGFTGGSEEGLEEEVEGDSAAEGGVDGVVEVGGEEDDAAEVFKFTKENADKLVPVLALVSSASDQ